MTVIENPARDPAFNLAAEEFLLTQHTAGDFLMFWINAPSVILGKFQNPFAEVSLTACEARGIPIVRRNSGGGCVYHDAGNLNYTILTDRGDGVDYERFLTPVVRALRSLGVPAVISDTSALTVDGCKISGNAQTTVGSRTLHHGTLLFDADLDVLGTLTGHARENVVTKAIPSKPSPVTNLRPYLRDPAMPIDAFAAAMTDALAGADPETRSFAPAEIDAIRALADEKYRTWAWNFGRSPAFTVQTAVYTIAVRHGIVEACDTEPLLVGQRFLPSILRPILGDEAVLALF